MELCYLNSNKKYIISSDSVFKITWDVILMIFLSINLFWIPIKMSFDFDTNDLW